MRARRCTLRACGRNAANICSEVPTMANYAKINIGSEGRVELHDELALTGAEISVNRLPAGAGVPFVHAHKNNEESTASSRARARPSSTTRKSPSPPETGCASRPPRSAGSPRRQTRALPSSAFRLAKTPSKASPPQTRSCADAVHKTTLNPNGTAGERLMFPRQPRLSFMKITGIRCPSESRRHFVDRIYFN